MDKIIQENQKNQEQLDALDQEYISIKLNID